MPTVPLLALSYVAGVGIAAWLGGAWWVAALLAALAVLALHLHVQTRPTLLVSLAVVAFAAAGHARLDAAAASRPDLTRFTGAHRIEARVASPPRVTGSQARVPIEVRAIDGVPAQARVSMSTRVDPDRPLPRAGDLLAIDGAIERFASRPDEAVVPYPAWRITGHEDGSRPVAVIEAIRAWSLANIERSFPEPHAALAAGVLIGEQGALPASLREALRTTGTTHLVVVSGNTNRPAHLIPSVTGLPRPLLRRRS